MKKKLMTIIELILVVIFLFSCYKIFTKLNAYKTDGKTYDAVRQEYIEEVQKSPENIDYKGLYNKLKESNTDYRGWITVENTDIDYPIVQGTDNDFYLKHDFNKKESISGCVFMDYLNEVDKDDNIILYGHNMRNGSMFSKLQNFKENEFFYQNNKVIIKDEAGEHTYEVFSVYVLKPGDKLGKINYSSADEFNEYIKFIKNKSFYASDIKVEKGDKILTLVTCTYEIDDARTIVHAKLIK